MVKSINTKLRIRTVDFNLDGSNIAAGTADGDVLLYKVDSNYEIEKLDSNRQRKSVITDIK